MAEIRTAALEVLPPGHDGMPDANDDKVPGMLYLRTTSKKVRLRPIQGATVLFGRNNDDVHLGFGDNDLTVSRVQGSLTFSNRIWWLRNLGRRPLQVPMSQELVAGGDPYPLPTGHTTVLLRTSAERVHTMEFYLADGTGRRIRKAPQAMTVTDSHSEPWEISELERLAIVATAQPYLRHEEHAEPWAHRAVAALLADVAPEHHWSEKSVARLVDGVRLRLAGRGVGGMTAEEVGTPVGNRLKHNLISELLTTETISQRDLRLLD